MRKTYALMIAFGAVAFSAAALADPPTVVARLSLADGATSIRHTYDQQWTTAGVNYPMIAGDAVWSDQGSHAAVEVGAASARLDQSTELDIDQLDDTTVALRVQQGAVNLMVTYVPPGGIQLLTSVGQLSIHRPGEYHVDAGHADYPTQLLLGVLSGDATFSGQRGVVELRSGQGAMVPPDQSGLQIVSIYPTDLDQWAESQESPPVAEIATYPDIPGYSELGHYGVWENDPELGQVWYPTTIQVGWAPYREGHWEYVRPWGWTWIDNARWGWAPFHYGRWAQFDGRWGWIPGDPREHHCYSPALVAFVGGTPDEHMDGGVGWVPLGPHEVFHPYYPHSDTYVLNINRANFHDEHDFRERESHWHGPDATVNNMANHAAVTQVSAATFTDGKPVHQNLTPQPIGPNRGPARVVSDFGHLPQPGPRPQPVQAPAAPQPAVAHPFPQPQQQQFQPHPGPQPQPQQFQPQQSHPTPMPQQQERPERADRPERAERPQPIQQPVPQPMQQYHPQQQQPQERPQPTPERQAMPERPQPMPERQAVPEYHPQPVQQYQPPPQQYHPPPPQPQPQQQQRSQPEPQSSGRRDEKDKRDPH